MPILLAYWGRRGPIGSFTFDLARAMVEMGLFAPTVCVSRSLEDLDHHRSTAFPIIEVPTFRSGKGVVLEARNILTIRRTLSDLMQNRRPRVVLTTMVHAWSPFVADIWRKNGVAHLAVVHDADPHPGDRTALLQRWMLAHATHADAVVTLSEHVANRLEASGAVPGNRILRLFLPDLSSGAVTREPREGRAVRFLFFGRIAAYKGLRLFADAVTILRARSLPFEAAVIGEGDLAESAVILSAAGVHVENRWVDEREVPSILGRYDVMVSCHTEASQSGVVALALGAGMPSIVTPVGGLPSQIVNGTTGILAEAVTAEAVADAMQSLIDSPDQMQALMAGVSATSEHRSFASFASLLQSKLKALPGF